MEGTKCDRSSRAPGAFFTLRLNAICPQGKLHAVFSIALVRYETMQRISANSANIQP
jgi:hypothetical protein